MTEPISSDSNARSIKKLTFAVWILVIITGTNLVISLFAALYLPHLARFITASIPSESMVSFSSHLREGEYNGFYDWPIEKQIQAASVIAVAKWQKEDKKLKCVITEILKQKPGTKFYYKVGDEYRRGSRYVKGNTDYGDGQIMFFTGSSASFQYSASFSDDSILGMGDMPIDELRKLIKKENH